MDTPTTNIAVLVPKVVRLNTTLHIIWINSLFLIWNNFSSVNRCLYGRDEEVTVCFVLGRTISFIYEAEFKWVIYIKHSTYISIYTMKFYQRILSILFQVRLSYSKLYKVYEISLNSRFLKREGKWRSHSDNIWMVGTK